MSAQPDHVHDRVKYWRKDQKVQNFGDSLSKYLSNALFFVFDEEADVRIIGSVIDDGFVPERPPFNLPGADPGQTRVIFWGCGMRQPSGLCQENRAKIEVLAVRGPLSASELRLGNDVPVGDPGLLLPALYAPALHAEFRDRSICIPHFNDTRSDEDLRAFSGCDCILRPNIGNQERDLLRFVDAVHSARFVLSASLHGAIAAVAYDRPFAFWGNGNGDVDLPFKWKDLAALIRIPVQMAANEQEGQQIFREAIAPRLDLPSLLPLLANAPFQIRPSALLRVMHHDLARRGAGPTQGEITRWITVFSERSSHFQTLAERTLSYHRASLGKARQDAEDLAAARVAAEVARLAEQATSIRQDLQQRLAAAQDESAVQAAAREVAEQQLAVQATVLAAAAADLAAERTRRAEAETAMATFKDQSAATEQDLQQRLAAAQDESAVQAAAREVAEQQLAVQATVLAAAAADLAAERTRRAEAETAMATFKDQSAATEQDLQQRLAAAQDESAVQAAAREVAEQQLAVQATVLAAAAADLAAERTRRAEAETAMATFKDQSAATEQDLRQRLAAAEDSLVAERQQRAEVEAALPGQVKALQDNNDQLARDLANVQGLLDQRDADLAIWIAETPYRDAELLSLREQQAAQQHLLDTVSAAFARVKDERNALSESVERTRHETGRVQTSAEQLRSRLTRLERTMARQVQTLLAESSGTRYRIGRSIGLAPPAPYAELIRNAALIGEFLDGFELHRLAGPDAAGRTARILSFLLASADVLDDLPLFDASAYLEMYPDVAQQGVNPLVHYIWEGRKRGFNLHPLIDTLWYRERYPDSTALEMAPPEHYVKWGVGMGYDPHPLFDTRYYLERYPDVVAVGINPLVHYLRFHGCHPHPLFDTDFYLRNNPDVAASGIKPLLHYLQRGAYEGRDPHPLFSSRFYLDTYPDIAACQMNPLVHYVRFGAHEGREPHPGFGSREYVAAHPEVAEAGLNPLVHFIITAIAEGRAMVVPPAFPAPAVAASGRKILLMVDACYPRPDRDSGSLDQISFVRIFQALGYAVHFAADIELAVETPYRDNLTAMGVCCLTYPDYVSIDSFLELHHAEIAVCFLSRVHFGARHLATVRRLCPQAKVVFNTVDLHHVREQRNAELNQDPELLVRAAETRNLELKYAAEADATIVVSDREAALLSSDVPQAHVFVVPLIREYQVDRTAAFVARSGIGFIGGFQHLPNVDAVTYFLDDIWPLVRKAKPDAAFFVIGPDVPDTLAQRRDPGVTFVGHVPDLEPWLERMKITVAPLRYGAGAKGKVVNSLAFGVPCVASPIAAEGMGLTDGQDILVGDTAQTFAERIVRLCGDEQEWTRLSDAGMALIRARHSLDHGITLLRQILDDMKVS